MLHAPSGPTSPVPITLLEASSSVTRKPGVPPEPLIVGVLSLVIRSVNDSPVSLAGSSASAVGAAGTAVSTTTVIGGAKPLEFPASSLTRYVTVWLPSTRAGEALMVQLPLPSTVAVPAGLPSTYSTTVWPGVSPPPRKSGVVSAVMLSVLERPVSELLRRSAGLVGVAGGVLSIVKESGADSGPVRPAASVAWLVMLCTPSASGLEGVME